MINIVIPMAGEGSRFKVAGYDIPKPFIEFNNKMMIEHVLSSFDNISSEFTLVVQEKFKTEQKLQLEKLTKNNHIKFVTVPRLTMGAAVTALASCKVLNKKFPVLFADSDNIFNNSKIKDFLLDAAKRNLDGSLLTFDSDNPCFSYAQTDSNGQLIKTKEKEIISNNAICGMYYFKNIDDFIFSAIDLIASSDLQNGEFYMSNVYNYFLKFKRNVGVYQIEKSDFICVGTPGQLNEYLKGELINEI